MRGLRVLFFCRAVSAAVCGSCGREESVGTNGGLLSFHNYPLKAQRNIENSKNN